MTDLLEPPVEVVSLAISIAKSSPCQKSRRGVATFSFSEPQQWSVSRTIIHSYGYNGPPGGHYGARSAFTCDGSWACRKDCGKRCVHAEARAIRGLARLGLSPAETSKIHLVHVKIDESDELVGGGGPSCWQCSREVVDVGLGGVWLYEMVDFEPTSAPQLWRFYDADTFHLATLKACQIEGPQ